jgi:hypothetical protein
MARLFMGSGHRCNSMSRAESADNNFARREGRSIKATIYRAYHLLDVCSSAWIRPENRVATQRVNHHTHEMLTIRNLSVPVRNPSHSEGSGKGNECLITVGSQRACWSSKKIGYGEDD